MNPTGGERYHQLREEASRVNTEPVLLDIILGFFRRLAAVAVIEAAGSEVKGTTLGHLNPKVIVQEPTQGPFLSLGCRVLSLATLCTHGAAFGGATRLLFG